MAKAMKGKKLLKSVLLAPKGKFRGIEENQFVWNGGNIYPVEIDGTEEDCHNLVRKIFANRTLVEKIHLTVANTANIGRLMPQSFFYTFAFSRLKKLVSGDIFYALAAGNYGNLVSGLYGWKLALPVNGFIVPSTPHLTTDALGDCIVMDSMIPLEKRSKIDPASPSNIERLEQVFRANALMLRSFVYPAPISDEEAGSACKELFVKYKIFADRDTAAAYGATRKRTDVTQEEDSAVVLIARDSPALDGKFLIHNLGECPETPENVKEAAKVSRIEKPLLAPDDETTLTSILLSLS
jgi:threonine synthase